MTLMCHRFKENEGNQHEQIKYKKIAKIERDYRCKLNIEYHFNMSENTNNNFRFEMMTMGRFYPSNNTEQEEQNLLLDIKNYLESVLNEVNKALEKNNE